MLSRALRPSPKGGPGSDRRTRGADGRPAYIDDCTPATERCTRRVYTELLDQRVYLEGTLLKLNMVLSGKEAGREPQRPEEVAGRTLRCL